MSGDASSGDGGDGVWIKRFKFRANTADVKNHKNFNLLSVHTNKAMAHGPHLKFAIRSHLVRCTSNEQSVMLSSPSADQRTGRKTDFASAAPSRPPCMPSRIAAKIGTRVALDLGSQR
jgi:hypothetical protein